MTTINAQVTADADDADETGSGTVVVTNVSIRALNSNYFIGMMFRGITIPSGSTISTCELVGYIADTSADDPGGIVYYFEENATPSAFSTATNNLSSRSLTSASVTDSGTSVGVGDRTISGFATALQELVDAVGGLSSADVVVIGNAGVSTVQRFQGYATSSSNAPRLNITYTAPGSTPIPVFMNQYRRRR